MTVGKSFRAIFSNGRKDPNFKFYISATPKKFDEAILKLEELLAHLKKYKKEKDRWDWDYEEKPKPKKTRRKTLFSMKMYDTGEKETKGSPEGLKKGLGL